MAWGWDACSFWESIALGKAWARPRHRRRKRKRSGSRPASLVAALVPPPPEFCPQQYGSQGSDSPSALKNICVQPGKQSHRHAQIKNKIDLESKHTSEKLRTLQLNITFLRMQRHKSIQINTQAKMHDLTKVFGFFTPLSLLCDP